MPRAVLAGAALLVLASGATQSDPLVPFHPVERRNRSANQGGTALVARTKGRPDAPITVYEMSDFQCPYCREFALKTMPVLEREYVATGKIRFIYINFPLSNIHAHAVAAAVVAMCAAQQGKFWPVHDRLFER